MSVKNVPNLADERFSMPKDWSGARVTAVLDKYLVCGDHLVYVKECGCKP